MNDKTRTNANIRLTTFGRSRRSGDSFVCLHDADEGLGEPAAISVTLSKPPHVLLLADEDHVSFVERQVILLLALPDVEGLGFDVVHNFALK